MKLNHTIEQLAAMTVRADSRPLAEDCLALIRENARLREALADIKNYHAEYDGDGWHGVANYYATIARRALGGSNE